jgi:hypothetical protein
LLDVDSAEPIVVGPARVIDTFSTNEGKDRERGKELLQIKWGPRAY